MHENHLQPSAIKIKPDQIFITTFLLDTLAEIIASLVENLILHSSRDALTDAALRFHTSRGALQGKGPVANTCGGGKQIR